MAKIIDALAVVETEDGYRIEIKGDKEKIRSFIASLGERPEWPRWYARRWSTSGGASDLHREKWMKALIAGGPWNADETE